MIGRPPAVRRARCAWRRRPIRYHHLAGIFVPTGLRSLQIWLVASAPLLGTAIVTLAIGFLAACKDLSF